MLLYKNQLIYLTKYKEPAIFLGTDSRNEKKWWVFRLHKNGKEGFVDDFYAVGVSYLKMNYPDKENCPTTGSQIMFGKYVKNIIFPIYHEKSNVFPAVEETMVEYLLKTKARFINE